ncbi:MAG TPA: 16S rRNA methyltransferase, partial [Lachnospiraceae bacterium]|nr:16S rRNA methyltransferase [Lachnospiraceae bacterium]
MYRFFVDKSQISEHEIRIEGADRNHIRNVLRMKPGEQIAASSGDSLEYTCQIKEYTGEAVIAEILYAQETELELASKIWLFQGLPKSDKMEFIIQKAVELGACAVVPMATKRAVVRLEGKKEEAKRRRWQGIAESAAKQAKRMIIPEIFPVHRFKDAVAMAETLDVRLIPYELAENMEHTREILSNIRPGQSVGLFIGPEGGF